MQLTTSTLAERPDLLEALLAMANPWPEFIRRDPFGDLYYAPAVLQQFGEHVLIGQDESGEVVAKAHAIPVLLAEGELPDDGWDGAIGRGLHARLTGGTPNALAALEILVLAGKQGQGLSAQMLTAVRENAARHGYADLVVPVRPTGKDDLREPMSRYAWRTREDGLPADPWLRVHVRAGGRIEKVAPRSMVVAGTLAEWRRWTGLPFDASGEVEVPGALRPVHCDTWHGTATYTEPNVWVRHRTGA
ncbi:N-acetyltransferase [Ruania zhangjianzhongii]|uniref:N-acetyltransferase n=1 Tax=Ruania zhangjianzhongii TaxID=2603206 RepID=UPI0011C94099|nr:N-acetyltransferase [Ruania zhangjianzhongii]